MINKLISFKNYLSVHNSSIKHSETSSSNEDTNRCCSQDHFSTSPLFRSAPIQRLGKLPIASSKGGIVAADSTSNNTGVASVNQPMPATPSVSTTPPYPNRQRIISGYIPSMNQSKRMVHKYKFHLKNHYNSLLGKCY